MRNLWVLLVIWSLTAPAPKARAAASDAAARYLDQFVDTGVSPRDDFFQHAVGKWLKANPIPANERSWGIAKVVQEETYQRLLAISTEAARDARASRGSNAQKIGDFWFSGMDTLAIARAGFAPLNPEFDRIAAVSDIPGLLGAAARLQRMGAGVLWAPFVTQDEKNSDLMTLHLYQGGLGLPNRDYYFDTDDRSARIRRDYEEHIGRMFELLGDDAARARAGAAAVMSLETELAGASRKLEDMRDPKANYNPTSLEGLAALSPSVRWRDYFDQGRVPALDTVVVGQPEFVRQVEKLLKSRSLEEWKTYLRWHLATAFAEEAGGRFDAEDFHFFGTILNGTPRQRPRWKRVLDSEEGYLGEALGQLYVQRYFSPATKERYLKLTDEVFAAFRERILALDWMSAPTKERALRKLSTVTKKVGYPDRWRDYSSYEINRESYLMNCVRGNIWITDYNLAKLTKPVDRTEWDMTPQTYNAYYNPSNNEIVLPAAIFILPGIADSLADDAIVYAYAGGTTIGHEITHGFDDEGRQFDEKGNLEDWWTKADETEFNRRAAGIVRQFNDYVVIDSLRVNGSATQGENIADLGGMLLGWDAFTRTEQYRSGKLLGGYTPAQRYFYGWALGWMSQLRPETQVVRIKSDVHAPQFLRVNGPVVNLTQFYEAFGVQPGDRMHRADADRVRIW